MTDLHLQLAGEEVVLLPERAALWVARRTLIAADLHWGKSEVLQRAGIPLHSGALAADCERLTAVLRRTGAERLLVLGDLVHAPSGLTPAVVDAVSAWRATWPDLTFSLLRGNHDRRVVWPDAWRLTLVQDGHEEGPFRFEHAAEPAPAADGPLTWSGHVHPSVTLRAGADRLRLPCFVVRRAGVLLPAFGTATGTHDLGLERSDRVYAVTDRSVMEVSG